MERKLSKYVRIVTYQNTVLLYNTVNRALVSLEEKSIDIEKNMVSLTPEEINELDEMDYFISDEEALAEYENVYNDDDQLIISVETHLKCNLSCPYCYQNGKKTNNIIEKKHLDTLYDYIVKNIGSKKTTRLVLKVLGGEPAIEWHKSAYILDRVYKLCQKESVELIVMVDTNGTMIDDLCSFNSYDKLVLTIPMIEKSLHDKVRQTSNKNGTYDLIIENIKKIQKTKERVYINIRYNVDNNNKDYFEAFVEDVKGKITKDLYIYTNYVMNLADCDYQNIMTLKEFNKWVTSVAIPVLIKHRVPITIAPTGAKNKCQCFSRYSLKLFSDGTVGPCAMYFFKKRISLDDFVEQQSLPDYWNQVKNLNILEQACRNCKNLFICNGARYMPCIRSVCDNPCDILDGEIDFCVDDFIRIYYDCILNDCEDLFIGFQEQVLR